MAYDEKADLDQHARDVEGLLGIARSCGIPTGGYSLGLDVGGGLGLHSPWLQTIVEKLYVTDIIDYNSAYDGNLNRLMIEKYARHHVPYDPARTEYARVDAQSLIYKDGLFDFVFSVNAFEHIPNPREAFQEIVRVTRSSALVMLQFDPLWHSPQGAHLWSLNLPPWAHLVLSPEDMISEILAHGGGDNEIHIYESQTNRQPLEMFMDLFKTHAPLYFENTYFNYWAKAPEEEPDSKHPNYKKCLAMGYTPEELLVRGIQFVGIRK